MVFRKERSESWSRSGSLRGAPVGAGGDSGTEAGRTHLGRAERTAHTGQGTPTPGWAKTKQNAGGKIIIIMIIRRKPTKEQ